MKLFRSDSFLTAVLAFLHTKRWLTTGKSVSMDRQIAVLICGKPCFLTDRTLLFHRQNNFLSDKPLSSKQILYYLQTNLWLLLDKFMPCKFAIKFFYGNNSCLLDDKSMRRILPLLGVLGQSFIYCIVIPDVNQTSYAWTSKTDTFISYIPRTTGLRTPIAASYLFTMTGWPD